MRKRKGTNKPSIGSLYSQHQKFSNHLNKLIVISTILRDSGQEEFPLGILNAILNPCTLETKVIEMQ